jgi:uncharacterized membrane protein YfcA
MFTPVDIFIVIGMMCVAAFVLGYGGLGFGIVSITLLSFLPLNIERLSVVVSLVSITVSFILMFISKTDGHIHWKKVFLLYTGIIVGLPIGYWFIETMGDKPVFGLILGIILVGYGLNGLRKPSAGKPLPKWSAPPIGSLSGFISGAFVSGGPPLVIYLYSQIDNPRKMKATIQAVFVIATLTRLILIGRGEAGYTMDVVWPALFAIPVMIPVLFISHWYSKKHSPETFRKVVNILIALFGMVKIVRALIQMVNSAG